MQIIENKKSTMMDHVLDELKDIISTLVVKKNYMAEREETLTIKQKADEYISAVTQVDVFYSYHQYSQYALNKAGLYDEKYYRDKQNIPREKRDEVVKYQREYIIATYEEPNNYYRALAGMPDIGDEPIYLDKEIDNVDTSKPLHEMDKDEILILKALGELDKIKEKYPDKKYLDHLIYERRIPIHVSRRTSDFDILYIKKDRSKQGVSDSFIGIYRQVRAYMLERFYDPAYKRNSPYYDAFIGIFILCVTIQRYITTYFEKFINRDFFNKDIIKLLFESYGLPFYNEIPLSYLQKVSKNLNRLLYYKATDHVFVDIFKIFDLDDINIYNYILFKDRIMDSNDKPVEVYKEKTELGYYVDTETYVVSSTTDFYGIKKNPKLTNIKKIVYINGCTLYLHNNGILNMKNHKTSIFGNLPHSTDEDGFEQFDDDYNISDIIELKSKLILKTKLPNKFYLFDNKNPIVKYEFDKFINNKYIQEVFICEDNNVDGNMYIGITTDKTGYVYVKGTIANAIFDKYTLVFTSEYGIIDLAGDYGSVIVTDTRGVSFVYGDNEFNRLHVPNKSMITTFESIENKIFNIKETHIFLKGTLFIMQDGTCRVTGYIPELGINEQTSQGENIVLSYQGIKTIQHWKNDKDVYFLHHYNNKIDVINYSPSDKYGALLFMDDVARPELRFKFIKHIAPVPSGLVITVYKAESYIYYSGENQNKMFPFIRTMSMIKEANTMKMKEIEIYDNVLYFATDDNRIVQYYNNEYKELDIFDSSEYIQKFKQTGGCLIVTVGKNYFIVLDKEKGIYRVDVPTLKPIKDIIIDEMSVYLYEVGGKVYRSNGLFLLGGLIKDDSKLPHKTITASEVEYFSCSHTKGNKYVKITPSIRDNKLVFDLLYKDGDTTINKKITNLYNCRRVTISDDVIFIEGKYLQYIKINEILDDISTVGAYRYDELNVKRAFSERVDGNLVIYNKSGGITLMKDFEHIDKLDSYIEGDYISLYDETNTYIGDITFNKKDLIQIQYVNKTVTYEPVVEKMYNLRFIEAPIDTNNLAEQFVDTANYLDYGLVVDEDLLWGGDGDKSSFVEEVLNSEFNYAVSKYISVNCRYDLTKLNFEICYMFRMLVDLKTNEKYMNFDVPYVGKVNLFDCIVGLFALTCMKLGFDGNIMDTKTKTLSVLGFNFKQDGVYIDKVLKKYNMAERNPDFKVDDVTINKAPALFTESPQIINLYLDNEDVVQAIYDYKYNAKTIQEYNAMKLIEQASVITKYTTDMYRKKDGTLPPTYLDYLQYANPKLYNFIKETDDENLIEQIDNLLVSLDNFLRSDKFKYLFLNIPTLSMDNIRRFIYYLIDIFKSYTVDLKAMNIIYHIDDKRISNIKMILQEGNFYKYFKDYTKFEFEDYIDYIFNSFYLYDEMKFTILETLNGKLTADDIIDLFKLYEEVPLKYHEHILPLLADFADIFDKMDDIMDRQQIIELVSDAIRKVTLPEVEKQLKNLRNSDKYSLKYNVNHDFILKILDKVYADKYMLIRKRIKLALEDKLNTEFSTKRIAISKILQECDIKQTKNDIPRDILPFDFSDHLETSGELIQQNNNKLNIRDTVYFIRKDG